MGRVARYKKIKACDPFSRKKSGRLMDTVWGEGDNGQKKKKRSLVAMRSKKRRRNDDEDGFNLPPSAKDEFHLADLMGSLKKERKPQASELLKDDKDARTSSVASSNSRSTSKVEVPQAGESVPDSLENETREAKILKLDTTGGPSSKKKEVVKRIEGESKKAFARRIKQETRQIIRNERVGSHNPEKKQRKKEFLNNKKKRKKGGRREYDGDDDYNSAALVDETDTFITGGAAARMSSPSFGEQVERPPEFKLLPRGATAKATTRQKSSKKTSTMDDDQVEAEKRSMEMMRRKVQAQYAVMKAKRGQVGDFHL